MKLGHLPAALAPSPGFVLQHGLRILRETFRGSSVPSSLGLEIEWAVFERYRALRWAERVAIWNCLAVDQDRTTHAQGTLAAA